MGIAPYKTFTFDGESSANYGVYLTGEGVFDAPERDVEMLDVPGRNGAYVQDKGKFKNIKVTYKAGMFDANESNFADKMSAFRNWLCSKKGYVRLEDEYNPNEYRMAVYYSGVEVEHEYLFAGQFEVTFECKPQRFLTSGETEQAVANNGTLTNPTLFDSSPLLAVKGYGNLSFNGYNLNIENAVMGNIYFADSESFDLPKTFTVNKNLFENGDTISVSGQLVCELKQESTSPIHVAFPQSTADTNASFSTSNGGMQGIGKTVTTGMSSTQFNVTFTAGTNSTVTNTATVIVYNFSTPTQKTTYTITQTITYTASSGSIAFSMSVSGTSTVAGITASGTPATSTTTIVVNSTKSALGNPTYIDCDIGECYMIQNDEIITLNNVVALGSDLPKLSSGTNTFTFDNTITSLKVTPRYWKV